MMSQTLRASRAVAMLATALSLIALNRIQAQGPAAGTPCPSGYTLGGVPDRERATQDACTLAVDAFHYLTPQLSIALAGGNATLGQPGTLSWAYTRSAMVLRASGLSADLPAFDEVAVASTGATPHEIRTRSQRIALPMVDLGIGILPGGRIGPFEVGALDLLTSVSYARKVSGARGEITPSGHWKFSYGARIGGIREVGVLPGIAVSWLRRDLPQFDVAMTAASQDSLYLDRVSVGADSWRLVLSKTSGSLSVMAGYGKDAQRASATARASVSRTGGAVRDQSTPVAVSQPLERTNRFLGLTMQVGGLTLSGEVGQVTGGEVATFSHFVSSATQARSYASVGFRIGG